MSKQGSGEQSLKPVKLTLLDLKEISFQLEGKRLNAEEATDAEFNTFIQQFIEIGWSLEERRDALNLALEKGTLKLEQAEKSNDL